MVHKAAAGRGKSYDRFRLATCGVGEGRQNAFVVAGSGVRCDALHRDVGGGERERSFENTRQNASDTGITTAAFERQEVGAA